MDETKRNLVCPALDCIFGGGICRGLKHTTAAFVSQRKKNQDKNKRFEV